MLAVDAKEFLGLEASHNPYRWHLPVVAGLCTGGNFLFGGCGLAAAIEALELTTERPLVWATAQFLNYASRDSVLDLDVTIAVGGRNTTQARVVGHVADREIFTVNAALGDRDLPVEQAWPRPLDVPPPEECESRMPRIPGEETIMTRMDVRLAAANGWEDMQGNPRPGGRSAIWARFPDGLEDSAAALAILGDYVPFGIGQALGAWAGGNSLDNTLRVLRPLPTDWVLLDIQVDGIARGFGQGTVHQYDRDGNLLATAGQSTIVRYWNHQPGTRPLDRDDETGAGSDPDRAGPQRSDHDGPDETEESR